MKLKLAFKLTLTKLSHLDGAAETVPATVQNRRASGFSKLNAGPPCRFERCCRDLQSSFESQDQVKG